MQDLQYFKNNITLILSKDRLAAYDSLEQYKENLKLIASITPKISNLENLFTQRFRLLLNPNQRE